MTDGPAVLRFDVLVSAEPTAPGADRAPPRPSGQRIDEVRRWLAAHGATCHPTGFGLACTVSRPAAALLFGPEPVGRELTVPTPIAHLVDQITVSVDPEYF